ncbi:MAG: NAD(P)/FAD-dependent oxidoreductase [Planctomycetota bacterium]
MSLHPDAQRWAILGGGVCGLTLALRLAEGGKQVTLFDASDRLGGLADAWQVGDLRWDRHYHVTLGSDRYTRALLQAVDLEQEMQWRTTRTGYFSGDRLVSMSNSWEYLKLPGLNLIDKMRLAWTILSASRRDDWQVLEGLTVEEWLVQSSGRKVFEKLWRPLLRAKLGESYPQCSAAFLWATIQRLYAARDSGMKVETFGYLPGGYGRFATAMMEKLKDLGVELRLATPVEEVTAGETGPVVRTATDAQPFDHVVSTTTPRRTAQLVPALSPQEQEQLQGIAFQGLLCASLVLEKPLADYYLTYLMNPDLPFTAVVEMSSFVDCGELQDKHLVYLPLYLSADDPRFQHSDATLQAAFLEGLARIYPNFDPADVLAFRISRVPEVFPLPTLHYSKQVPPRHLSVDGVHMVGASQIINGTLNVNESVRLAEEAAEEFLR